MTHRLAPHGSLLIQSWVQAGRLLLRWRRDQAVLMGSLLLPVFLLFVYKLVLGEQVHKVTGVDSVYGVVPMCAVISALFGSLGNSVGITMDRQSRLLSRMWVLPIHRASAISGWVIAEIARVHRHDPHHRDRGRNGVALHAGLARSPTFRAYPLDRGDRVHRSGDGDGDPQQRPHCDDLAAERHFRAGVRQSRRHSNQAVSGLGSAFDPHATDVATN